MVKPRWPVMNGESVASLIPVSLAIDTGSRHRMRRRAGFDR